MATAQITVHIDHSILEDWIQQIHDRRKANSRVLRQVLAQELKDLRRSRTVVGPDGLSILSTGYIRRHMEEKYDLEHLEAVEVRYHLKRLAKEGLVVEYRTPVPNNHGGHTWLYVGPLD